MAELALAYKVRSYSTGTLGRSICNARNHHWVADDSGGEEIGAGELFLSGISACAISQRRTRWSWLLGTSGSRLLK